MKRPVPLLASWLLAALVTLPCCLAEGAGPASVQGSPATAEAHHAAAMNHLKAGRLKEALAELQQALRLNRNYVPALLETADLLSSTGHHFEAYGVLQHAATLASASPRVHLLLGRCFFYLKKFKEAREKFHRALELDPALTEPHFALAVIEAEQGRLAEAEGHAKAYLERASGAEAAQAWEVLARISLETKNYDGALRAYAALRKADPTRSSVRMQMAHILFTAGRYAEAEEAFRQVLKESPEDRDALRGLYESSHKRGAYEQALLAMQRFAKLEPWSCEPHLNLARTYRMLNQFPQARVQAESCLRLVPGHAAAHYMLGRTWYRDGNLARAKAELEQAIATNPNYAEALYWLATVELRLGEAESALPRLEKAVLLDPNHAAARYALALEYSRQKRTAEAKEQLEEFRRLKDREEWKSRSGEDATGMMGGPGPGGPVSAARVSDWINFAKYLVQENKPRDALLVAQEAKGVAPEDPEVLRMIAVAHAEAGEVDKALVAYAEAEKYSSAPLLFLGRAKIYFRLEEEELAMADLRRASSGDLPPDKRAEAHLLLASLFNKQKRYEEAQAQLHRVLELQPDDLAARVLLGWTLLQQGKPAEAATEALQVLRNGSDNPSARLVLAQALLDQKQAGKAGAEIAGAAAIEGESGRILLARGRLAMAQGMNTMAIDYLTRAGQVDPSQVEAFYYLGMKLVEERRPREAATALGKAIIVDPAHAPSWLELGKIYLALKQTRAAVTCFRRAVASAPESAEAHYQLAVALGEAEQFPEAEQAARHARGLGHPAADALLQSFANQNPR